MSPQRVSTRQDPLEATLAGDPWLRTSEYGSTDALASISYAVVPLLELDSNILWEQRRKSQAPTAEVTVARSKDAEEETRETDPSQSTSAKRLACSVSTSRAFSAASLFASEISCYFSNSSCVRSISSFCKPSELDDHLFHLPRSPL